MPKNTKTRQKQPDLIKQYYKSWLTSGDQVYDFQNIEIFRSNQDFFTVLPDLIKFVFLEKNQQKCYDFVIDCLSRLSKDEWYEIVSRNLLIVKINTFFQPNTAIFTKIESANFIS